MLRVLSAVARGGRSAAGRGLSKPTGMSTTALVCICSLWNVGQTLSFATVRTSPRAMSKTVDVSAADVGFDRALILLRLLALVWSTDHLHGVAPTPLLGCWGHCGGRYRT